MRFRIDVVPSKAPEGWSVAVRAHGDGWTTLTPRELSREKAQGLGLPRPPAGGLGVTGPGAALAGSAEMAATIFQRIRDQQTQGGDLAAFGHYLFETLLGASLWAAMSAHAQNDAELELELYLRADDKEMMRLPWEALHDGKAFLTLSPRPAVSLTRVVSTVTAVKPPTLELPLRVLFVMGAPLSDKRLQPGAEYYGLLRSMRAEGLSLRSRLLLDASSVTLEQAIKDFRPAVVHVIGHGGVDEEGGYIELMSTTPGQGPDRVGAQKLESLIRPEGAPAPLMLLNTCYSGTEPEAGNLSTPLAVELVEKGVPLVVAMAGRVLDAACRLFTRGFYHSLVKGTALPSAVATGRSAGFKHAKDPEAVDWALPILVTPPLDSVAFTISKKPPESIKNTEKRLRPDINPTILCDRHEFLIAYQELGNKDSSKVLVVRVQDPVTKEGDLKYGMSRLLQELAVQALDDGYLPSLVRADSRTLVKNLLSIVGSILDEAKITAKNLSPEVHKAVTAHHFEIDKLKRQKTGNPLPSANASLIENLLLDGNLHDAPQVLRAALMLDLLSLGKMTGRPPLVLVDGVHWFGEVENFLHMLEPQGLGEGETDIPIILGCKLVDRENTLQQQVQSFLKEKTGYIKVMDLAPFKDDETEKHLTYQQFLLGWRGLSGQEHMPLVISRKLPFEDVQAIINHLHEEVRGIPSRLRAETTASAILAFKVAKVLTPANDEDALNQWKAQQEVLAKTPGGQGMS